MQHLLRTNVNTPSRITLEGNTPEQLITFVFPTMSKNVTKVNCIPVPLDAEHSSIWLLISHKVAKADTFKRE